MQLHLYVYLAVDVFTYDLLHIDLYPHLGKDQARAFLQDLKAKGYLLAATLFDQPLAKFDEQTCGREKRPRRAS